MPRMNNEEAIQRLLDIRRYCILGAADTEALKIAVRMLNSPVIEIDGKHYKAEKPILKTVHKWGEVVIGGFREVEE